MSSQTYYNRAAADWANQNITQSVAVTPLFSSRLGRIFTYSLLLATPGFFFFLGLVAIALGAQDTPTRYGPFVIGFLVLFPCCGIILLGFYIRRGFPKSFDGTGVNGSMGVKHPWSKLYYMNHVTKHTRAGHVSRQVKDNQIELVFEGGKVVVPPLIHNHAAIWDLLGRIPAEVRDDGVKRNVGPGGQPTPEEALMAFLNAQK